jgi:hypothetical protein
MAEFTVHPHFTLVTLAETSKCLPYSKLLRELGVPTSLVRPAALYAYSTNLLLLRRLAQQVLHENTPPRPFAWPATKPRDWLAFFTDLTEPWSLRYTQEGFQVWDGEQR